MSNKTVVILGASDKSDRYSYKALRLLAQKGYEAIPVHPKLKSIEDFTVINSLAEVTLPVDTLTLYVNEQVSSEAKNEILKLKPRRVIFNPGAENPDLEKALEQDGIETLEACTLVMLNTGQF